MSCTNTSGSLGEREMLWEHELQASVSTAFSSSPKLSLLNFVNFDYQNVTSLCSRHHYVNNAQ